MPELLTKPSAERDWKRISAESSFMYPRRPNRSRDWTEVNWAEGLNWTLQKQQEDMDTNWTSQGVERVHVDGFPCRGIRLSTDSHVFNKSPLRQLFLQAWGQLERTLPFDVADTLFIAGFQEQARPHLQCLKMYLRHSAGLARSACKGFLPECSHFSFLLWY